MNSDGTWQRKQSSEYSWSSNDGRAWQGTSCSESSLLPVGDDAGELSQSRQVRAAIRREGTCETKAAPKHQDAGAQALDAIPKRESEKLGLCTADKLNSQLWTSTRTATGQDARRPDGRLRLRTRCLVSISLQRRQRPLKCGGDMLRRNRV